MSVISVDGCGRNTSWSNYPISRYGALRPESIKWVRADVQVQVRATVTLTDQKHVSCCLRSVRTVWWMNPLLFFIFSTFSCEFHEDSNRKIRTKAITRPSNLHFPLYLLVSGFWKFWETFNRMLSCGIWEIFISGNVPWELIGNCWNWREICCNISRANMNINTVVISRHAWKGV